MPCAWAELGENARKATTTQIKMPVRERADLAFSTIRTVVDDTATKLPNADGQDSTPMQPRCSGRFRRSLPPAVR